MRVHPNDQLPTLLVLAPNLSAMRGDQRFEPISDAPNRALQQFDSLTETLHKALASNLPMLFVANPREADIARHVLPGDCVLELTESVVQPPSDDSGAAQAIVAGVLASANANGWLMLPSRCPMLRPETLRQIATIPQHQPVVFPMYRQMPGLPIRFSAEFFSELVRLKSDWDFNRLIARYPSTGIDVDDPGVLMGHSELTAVMGAIQQDGQSVFFPSAARPRA